MPPQTTRAHPAPTAGPSGAPGQRPHPGDGVPLDAIPQGGATAAPEGATDAVQTGLRALVLTGWLMVQGAAVLPLVQQQLRAGGTVTLGVCLMLLHQVVVPAGIQRRVRSRGWYWAAGLLYAASLGLLYPIRNHMHPVNYWAPGYWALPWMVWSLLVLRRREYLRLLAVGLGGLTLVDAVVGVVGSDLPWTLAAAPAPWIVVPASVMVLFGDGLLQLAREVDEAVRRRREVQAASSEREARDQARSEAARLLHDHVLHALHALARVGEHVSPAMAREECAHAVEALARGVRAEEQTSVRELLANDPVVVRGGATLLGTCHPVPADVAHAMAAAAHEALVNAELHGQARQVTVQLAEQGDQRVVEVVDDGRGFDPERVSHARLGLHRSVLGRMDDVGGEALVHTQRGIGTRVVLRWPREHASHVDPVWAAHTNSQLRRILLRTALPGLAVNVVMTLLLFRQAHPVWAALAVAAVQVGVGVGGFLTLRRGPLRVPAAVLLLATSIASWCAALAIAPAAVDNVYQLWLAWGCAALLHLVVLQVPLRPGVAVLVGWATAMSAALALRYPDVDWGSMHPLVSAGVAEAVVTLVALHAARRLLDRRLAERRAMDHAQRRAARARLTAQVSDFWSQQVTGDALPLLESVALGRTDASDPAATGRARLLETNLRDELVLGPDQPELLAALGRARAAGWTVSVPMASDHDRLRLPVLARLVDLLGPASRPGQAAMLSVSADQVAVVMLDPDAAQAARWRSLAGTDDLLVDATDEFIRLRFVTPFA